MSDMASTSAVGSDSNDGGEPPRKQNKSDQCTRQPTIDDSANGELAASGVNISDFPEEVIVRILSNLTPEELLDVAQYVCTRWRRLAYDPEVWYYKEFCMDPSYSDDEAVAVLKQMPQLRAVVLRHEVESRVIEALCDSCSGVTALQLHRHQQMSLSLLEKLVQRYGNMQSLCIPHHLVCEKQKSETLAQLSRLESLELLGDSMGYGIVHLRPLADGCPKLARLKVGNLVCILWEDVEYFCNIKCNTLTHVTLPWNSKERRCVVPLLKACTSLSHLKLHGCSVLSDEAAAEAFTLIGSLSKLHSLAIEGVAGFSAELLALTFKSGGLSRLQVLKFVNSALDTSAMMAVCRCCPDLKKLVLKKCEILCDFVLGDLWRLAKLETLDLSGSKHLGRCVILFVAQLPNLRNLFLRELNAKYLQPGLENVLRITSLESLDIGLMQKVKLFPFSKLHGNLVNLRRLGVRGMSRHDPVLQELKEQMPGLQLCYD